MFVLPIHMSFYDQSRSYVRVKDYYSHPCESVQTTTIAVHMTLRVKGDYNYQYAFLCVKDKSLF